jgi:hypothetical protein
MPDAATWVTDTSVYTHFSRAGHTEILERLAPGGVILVPDEVNAEIQVGREHYSGIIDPVSTSCLTSGDDGHMRPSLRANVQVSALQGSSERDFV